MWEWEDLHQSKPWWLKLVCTIFLGLQMNHKIKFNDIATLYTPKLKLLQIKPLRLSVYRKQYQYPRLMCNYALVGSIFFSCMIYRGCEQVSWLEGPWIKINGFIYFFLRTSEAFTQIMEKNKLHYKCSNRI